MPIGSFSTFGTWYSSNQLPFAAIHPCRNALLANARCTAVWLCRRQIFSVVIKCRGSLPRRRNNLPRNIRTHRINLNQRAKYQNNKLPPHQAQQNNCSGDNNIRSRKLGLHVDALPSNDMAWYLVLTTGICQPSTMLRIHSCLGRPAGSRRASQIRYT